MKDLDRQQYWASLPDDEFLDEAHARIEEYYDDLQTTGLFYVWEKSFRAYYGARLNGKRYDGQIFDSSEVVRTGKNGEITNLKTNHYRNLLQHSLQLATSQRVAMTCQATNSDYKSQTQTIFGKGLVDYYFREKNVERHRNQAAETGLVFSEGWVHARWNPTEGEIYDYHSETQAPIHEGDLEFSVHSPLDVPRDISLKGDDHDWLFVRAFENKFDLASKHPEKAEDILAETSDSLTSYEQYDSFDLQIRKGSKPDTSRVPVWTFYHRKTESMPQGRMVVFVNKVKLFDGPIPYRKLPLYCFSPENLMETPYGYSPAFDLLAPQEALDILTSTLLTNNSAFGVQNIWSRRDDNISVTQLGGGLKHLQSDEKPESLQLTQSAPETYEFRQQLIAEMETLSGISATVRGNPELSLKSGAALALVVSQSIQFANLIEESLNTLTEDLATAIIDQLRDFGQTPRIANILGESNRPFQKTFTSDDLAGITRVVVERVSPLSKTIAGKIQLADSLLEKGFISNAKQYITVLTTGQLDPAIENVQHELLNIRAENEAMRNGQQVMAVVSDQHADHIREHLTLIANPEARYDPQFVQTVLNHVQEHLNQWRSADPAILMITGQQPPPPPPGMMPPGPPPPGGPQGGPPPAEAAPGPVPQMMDPTNPLNNELPDMPNMPNLPEGAPMEAQAAYDDNPIPPGVE